MTVINPLNDKHCLSLVLKEAERLRVQQWFEKLVRPFESRDAFVAYIRSLVQRDDLGDPDDGPRIPCNVSQRVRFAPSDPNCVERSVYYVAGAEILEPTVVRTLASLVFDEGWHTFPVEFHKGRPRVVVLDPISPPRNTMLATAYRAGNVSPMARQHLVPWFTELARNACLEDGGWVCYQGALQSLRNALVTGAPLDNHEDLDYVLERAAEDAELWGGQGRAAIDQIQRSIRNLSFKIDKKLVAKFVNGLVDTAEKLAPEAIKSVLVAKYGPAAAVALQGVDLALEEPTKAKAGPETKSASQVAKASKNASKTAKKSLRRMTLAFRQ